MTTVGGERGGPGGTMHTVRLLVVVLGLGLAVVGPTPTGVLFGLWAPLIASVAITAALSERLPRWVGDSFWSIDLLVVLGTRVVVDAGGGGEPLIPLLAFPIAAGLVGRLRGVLLTVLLTTVSFSMQPAATADGTPSTAADLVTAVGILGAVAACGAIVAEVHDRQRDREAAASARVRRLEAVLSAVVHHDPRGIIVRDHRGAVVEMNAAACAIIDIDAEEFARRAAEPSALRGDVVDEHGRPFPGPLPAELARWSGVVVGEVTLGVPAGDHQQWIGVNAIPVETADGRWVVSQLRDVTAERRAQSLLQQQAHVDPLTGAGNRRLLEATFDDLEEAAHQIAVLVVDLDRFKAVNDEHGHAVGDEILAEVTERVRGCTRADDTVVRLGGDEFAAVLAEVDGRHVDMVVDRMQSVLQAPYTTSVGLVESPASIGHAIGPASTARQLLRDADRAMYDRKRDRRADLSDIS